MQKTVNGESSYLSIISFSALVLFFSSNAQSLRKWLSKVLTRRQIPLSSSFSSILSKNRVRDSAEMSSFRNRQQHHLFNMLLLIAECLSIQEAAAINSRKLKLIASNGEQVNNIAICIIQRRSGAVKAKV